MVVSQLEQTQQSAPFLSPQRSRPAPFTLDRGFALFFFFDFAAVVTCGAEEGSWTAWSPFEPTFFPYFPSPVRQDVFIRGEPPLTACKRTGNRPPCCRKGILPRVVAPVSLMNGASVGFNHLEPMPPPPPPPHIIVSFLHFTNPRHPPFVKSY